MKSVIRFSRARYWFFAFSLAIFVVGAVAYVVNGGFNLGVDFKAGIAMQFQVAPASFSLVYEGADKAELTIPAGEQALTAAGNFIITVSKLDGTKKAHPFRFVDYATIRDFTDAVAKVEGVRVTVKGDANASPKSLIPLVRPADITKASYTINISPETEKKTPIGIADIRDALAAMGAINLQTVGSKANQEFIARKEAPATPSAEFQTNAEQELVKLLGDGFGTDQVILKSTNFVGARLSQALAT
jgi:preprotein translocase subunit SecF